MATKSNVRQLTLHFVGDNTHIIDTFKERAKRNFRTTEQEILFELAKVSETLITNHNCLRALKKIEELEKAGAGIVPAPAEPTAGDIANADAHKEEIDFTL